MTEIHYTEEQRAAIGQRGDNLLISAAAGSGKTQVLIERIVQMIVEDRVPLERMVVVTFTNAAAAEMKTRLAQSLHDAIAKNPEDREYLSSQLRALAAADVSTLHAYCMKTMRRYYQVIQLPADFRVASDAGQTVLKEQALEATMEAFYDSYEPQDPFYRFVEAYGGSKSDTDVKNMVQKTANFLRTLADGEAWIEKTLTIYRRAKEGLGPDDPFLEMFTHAVASAYEESRTLLEYARTWIPYEGPLAAFHKSMDDDHAQLELVRQALEEGRIADVKLHFPRLVTVPNKNLNDEESALKELYKDIRQQYKDRMSGVLDLLSPGGSEKILADRRKILPYLEVLLELCGDYQERYQALKAERHEVDYNDLEHAMLAILADDEARTDLRAGIDAIFFDEYQDANDVQEHIINALAPQHGLFYVGDVKQAIYSFRFADPSIFNRRKARYDKADDGRVIYLADNFRSVEPILDFANALFADLMTPDLGEVDYLEPGQALSAHREADDRVEETVQVVLLDRQQDSRTVAEGEALWIAQEAKRLVEAGRFRYADMAVLMRSPSSSLAAYEKIFKEENIPFYSDNSSVDFSNMEVRIFHNLLKVLHNDQQDLPLISILLSPFAGLEEEELAQIRLHAPDAFFYDACRLYADDLDDSISAKLKKLYQFLDYWREQLTRRPIGDVVEAILEESGYGAFLIALERGEERLEHVMAFIERIRDVDEETAGGLAGFLNYADVLKQRQGDRLTPSIGLTAQDDRLQIMSIHKSKGLGFSVVFLADMAHRFNFSDRNQELILRRKEGLGMKVVDLELQTSYSSLEHRLLKEIIEQDTRSEELRLLYVAITRAKDRLYLIASLKDLDADWTRARDKLEQPSGSTANSFADWLLGRLAKPADVSRLSYEGQLDQPLYGLRQQSFAELQDSKEIQQHALDRMLEEQLPAALQNSISEKLGFRYPFIDESQRAVKTTVTDLTEAWNANAFPPGSTNEEVSFAMPQPAFISDGTDLMAKEAGSLLHRVLQWLPLDSKKEDLLALLDHYEREGRITVDERKALGDAKSIQAFLASPLAAKAAQASVVRRELPFTMRYEEMIIDGQMDLVFIDDEGIHLVDFKSDQRMQPERYAVQIGLYARAIEKAWAKPLASAHIFWLRHGCADALGLEDRCLPEIPIIDPSALPFDEPLP